jgi:GrpB-like predicted nucleotidyltransferase (UPF0157 family)
MDLGLRREIVELVPHRPAWKKLFAEEKDRLEEVIGVVAENGHPFEKMCLDTQ